MTEFLRSKNGLSIGHIMRTIVLSNGGLARGLLPSVVSIGFSGMVLVRASEVPPDARAQDLFVYITVLLFASLVCIGAWKFCRETIATTFQVEDSGIRYHSVLSGMRHIAWEEISRVVDTSLTAKDNLGKLVFKTVQGKTIPFVYSAFSHAPEVKRAFLEELSRKLPASIPVESENSSLAEIRRSRTKREAPDFATNPLVVHGIAKGALSERWTGVFAGVFANVVLAVIVLVDWNVGSLMSPSSWSAHETPVVLAAAIIVLAIAPILNTHAIWGLLSREHDTRLFVSARRIARIAPRATEVLDTPIARIQALPLSVVAADGRRIRLALGPGRKPGLRELRTMMRVLNLTAQAKSDLARYLLLAHYPKWLDLAGAACIPTAIYLGAVSLYFESRFAIFVATAMLFVGVAHLAHRTYRFYQIGRTHTAH